MARLDLSKLNPPQREAVVHGEGPLLVLAGAGSGKTRVIAHRVAHLIERGVAPDQILAVTFTNKAAAEMRQRVAALAGKKQAGLATVGTFHAFGYGLVKSHARKLGFPGRVAVADSSDQVQVIKRALRDVRVDDRTFDVHRVLSIISRAKDDGRAPQPTADGRAETQGADYELIASLVYERYQRSIKTMGMVDFDDLLALPARLLEDDAEVRETLQARYRYLLVDEYQDTNSAQLRLLKLLAGAQQNVCAVGDDDQSIYGWRGAQIQNILGFDRHFAGAREVRLTQNYRSTGAVLKCANAVIRENPGRKAKELWTDRGDGDPVAVVALPGEDEEARFVVERIVELKAQGRNLDEIAILFRTNAQSRPFEEQLRPAGIPYDVVGGTSFFDRKDVKDLTAYLKLVVNRDDEVALLRIVNVPARGIGETTLEKAQSAAVANGLSVMATLERAAEFPELAQVAPKFTAFLALIDELRELFSSRPLGVAARALIERTGLRKAAEGEKDPAVPISDILEAVCLSLDHFAEQDRAPSLSAYLARLALDGRREEAAPGEGGRVVLMTLHAVKGLEFPVVFLVGMEEGLLPHGGMKGQPPDLEEEQRLCYVGITRAREQLTLTRAAQRLRRGSEAPRTPSRFLAALPAEQTRVVDLAAKAVPVAPSASKFWALAGEGAEAIEAKSGGSVDR